MIQTKAQSAPRWLLPLSLLAGGLTALLLGFPAEWDLLNYHLYGPHALLHDRLWIDWVPAQSQTFLNPLFHLPWYSLFYYAHPAAMVFTLGLLQGLHWLLLYRLLAELVRNRPVPQWALLLVSALGLTGPIFFAGLGGTQGDTVISLLVLYALLIAVQQVQQPAKEQGWRTACLCGLLLGIATALKLIFALYTLALGVAWLVCAASAVRLKVFFTYGMSAFIGFLLAGIAWCSYLYFEYQNPFFPYFNQFFHSSWVGESSFRDLRFLPETPLQWWFYPFYWLENNLQVWEWPTRDVRMVALYPLVAGLLLFASHRMWLRSRGLMLLMIFTALAYAIWLPLFSIYRYLSVIELLIPVLFFAAAVVLYRRRHLATVVLGLLVAGIFANEYWRSESLWELNASQPSILSHIPQDSLVVINGYEPLAFAALWLDDRIPMVRTRANFLFSNNPPFARMQLEAYERVKRHRGPIYLLIPENEFQAEFLGPDMARMNLHWQGAEDCDPVFSDNSLQQKTGLYLCRLVQLSNGPVQIADAQLPRD